MIRDRKALSSSALVAALVGALALVCLICAGPGVAGASAAEPPEFLHSFGPDGTASSSFGEVGSIAVDQQTDAVYVLDSSAGLIFKFDGDGNPLPFTGSAPYLSGNELSGLSFLGCGCQQVAVDSNSHRFYVTSAGAIHAYEADGDPAEFTAGPGIGTNSIGGFNGIRGLAVDVDGNIYASDENENTITVFAGTGEPITSFSVTTPSNLAVDTNGTIYFAKEAGVGKATPDSFPISSSTTYTLAAELIDSSGSPLGVAVDPSNNEFYVGNFFEAGIAWYDEEGNRLGLFAKPGEEGEVPFPFGLAVIGADQLVFAAANPLGGRPQVNVFGHEVGPPVVRPSVTDVTADSAELRASINPLGAETSYRIEYGLTDCSLGGCTVITDAGATIAAGRNFVSVAQALVGLTPDVTYHYRVVAENSFGVTDSGDRTFTMQGSALGFKLVDRRAWEMVSPPDKHGAVMLGTYNAFAQAAADGLGLAYPARGSIEGDPEGSRLPEPTIVLARRSGVGWESKDIRAPGDRTTGPAVGSQTEYKLFSTNLERGFLEPRTPMPLTPDATERTPYLRENSDPFSLTALITPANVPAGTEFGGDEPSLRIPLGPAPIVAATDDLSHLVLDVRVPLVEGAPPAPEHSLYLWEGGKLEAVNVLPAAEGGQITPTDVVGSGSHKISDGHSVENAISQDGSRVFWSTRDHQGDLAGLYLRDVGDEETVRLDLVEPGATGAGEPNPIFQSASIDGTVVFFTDSQQLTADASPSGRDLYRCEIPAGSPAGGCSNLEDISAPFSEPVESSEVQGLATGVSDDGSTIYFVARGVLDEAANDEGNTAVAEEPNLYVWQETMGTRYIATLAKADQADWGSAQGLAARRSAAVSPSGRYLAFSSERPLAGKDNLSAETGEPVQQVYRYDRSLDRLDCMSCNPSNAAPEAAVPGIVVDPRSQWLEKEVSATLPEPTVIDVISEISLYAPRTVLNNGRVYFNTVNPLVPADVNKGWDVYQSEPDGVGDCSTLASGAATSSAAGGCVSLISSGTGKREAGFLDASASGDDVFFLSPAPLSKIDKDQEVDVYDARVDGVAAVPSFPSECSGEGCQPPPQAPADSTPGTLSFAGPGNPKPSKRCRKSQRKVRRHGKTVCVKARHHKKRKGKHEQDRQLGIVR